MNDYIKDYEKLILEKRDFIALQLLVQKIKSEEVGKKFSKAIFKNAIYEANNLLGNEKESPIEPILQKLESYFIEILRKENYALRLTNYAEKYLGLIDNQVNNAFRNIKLRQTFANLFTFHTEITDIGDLEQWNLQQFLATKESIFQHIAGFSDEVRKNIQEISILLQNMQKENEDDFLISLKHFETNFKELGDKAEDIKEVLGLKNKTLYKLSQIVEGFVNSTNTQSHEIVKLDKQAFEKIRREKLIAEKIEQDVKDFFKEIDILIDDITDRLTYAFERQQELMKNFQQQSKLKNNLQLFLQFLFETTEIDKENTWILDKSILMKSIPNLSHRFLFVPKHNFNIKKSNEVEDREEDEQFMQQEKEKADREDKINQQVSYWLTHLKAELQTKDCLMLHDLFYEIWEKEGLWEIPLKVSSELIRYATSQSMKIEVEPTFSQEIQHHSVLIWKTKILKT